METGKMKKRNQKGFSLLEVMVTVAMIGVISAIAVPSYNKYMRSAKTAEAQSSMGQVYMAEKSFFLQWRFYTTDLKVIGVAPDGAMLYNVGFQNPVTPDLASYASSYRGPCINGAFPAGDSSCDSTNSDVHNMLLLCGQGFGSGKVESCAFTNNKIKATDGGPGFSPPNIPSCTAIDSAGRKFIVAAIADIINKKAEDLGTLDNKDLWTIDSYKQIERQCDGTSGNTCTCSATL